jgi:hypothetical protein
MTLKLAAEKLNPSQLSKAEQRVKRYLINSAKGRDGKGDPRSRAKAKEAKVKEAIYEAKLAVKEAAQYVVALKREQVKAQRSLEKAQRHLARLQERLAGS